MKWVNVYEVTRCYGGPEEGGWYFDAYELIDSEPVGLVREEEVLTQYREEYNGDEYAVYLEDSEGESETKERPTYC